MRSYPKSRIPITKLKPSENATAKGFGGQFKVIKFVRGFKSYSSPAGVLEGDPSNEDSETAFLIRHEGQWPKNARLQVVAVSKAGKRRHLDRYFRFDRSGSEELIIIKFGLQDLDHLELREYVDQSVFFFQGVNLPQTSLAAFLPGPQATVSFSDESKPIRLDAFLPLDVTIRKVPGRVSGTASDNFGPRILKQNGDAQVEEFSTIVVRIDGCEQPNRFPVTLPNAPGNRGGGSASGRGQSLMYKTHSVTAEEIKSATIRTTPPNPATLQFPNQ